MQNKIIFLLQIYTYKKEPILAGLARHMEATFGIGGTWRVKGFAFPDFSSWSWKGNLGLFEVGYKKRFAEGCNSIKIKGRNIPELEKIGIDRVDIDILLQAQNSGWKVVGRDINYASILGREERYAAMHARGSEQYIENGRGDYPSMIVMSFNGSINSSDLVPAEIEKCIATHIAKNLGDFLENRYVGYFDSGLSNNNNSFPIADARTYMRSDYEYQKMDMLFDQPHLGIFGPNSVIKLFADSVKESGVDQWSLIETEKTGLVLFSDIEESMKCYFPEWHIQPRIPISDSMKNLLKKS